MESRRDRHSHLALGRAAQIRENTLDSGIWQSMVEHQLGSSIPVPPLLPASSFLLLPSPSVSLPVLEAGLELVISPLTVAS